MKDVHSKPLIGSIVRPIYKCKICGEDGFQRKSGLKHLKKHSINTLSMTAVEVNTFYLAIKCMCGREIAPPQANKHLKEHLSGAENYYIFGDYIDSAVEHKAISFNLFKKGA